MARFINLKSAAVALVAVVGVIAVYPEAIRFLPYLLLLACPLSMMFMHGGHGGHDEHMRNSGQAMKLGDYVCPMHDEVRSTFPGECPVCGMELEPAQPPAVRR